MPKILLGYWDITGLGEAIRWLLHFKNVPFEDKRYKSKEDWFEKDKFSLGLAFPNLPYYMEDDLKITQSCAILRYLAEKYDFGGKTMEERIRINMAEQQIVDWDLKLVELCYKDHFEAKKEEFIANVPAQFKLLENFLGNRKFLAGDNLSYVDFFAYQILDNYRMLIANVFDNFPRIQAYRQRIIRLPELQSYLKSSDYRNYPIFTSDAYFGNAAMPPPPHA